MRVLVIGAGVTGAAVVRHFAGGPAEVIVADDAPARAAEAFRVGSERAPAAPVVVAGVADLDGVDLVVPSPGVPPSHPLLLEAEQRGISVRSEIDLAAEAATVPLVAVTGTNGKTTVTTLIAAMLHESGVAATTAGNIGTPLLQAVREPATVLVAEVSSFQLHFTTTAFAPRVAVLLNVAADHLDWHGDLDGYRRDKALIFAHQGPDDLLVANVGDATVAHLVGAARSGRTACFAARDSGLEVTGSPPPHLSPAVMSAVRDADGRPAVENAVAAALAALAVGATDAGVLAALRAQMGLHHRVEPVGQAGGVRFYDDSKATNPHATRAAVVQLGSDGDAAGRVVLVAGGRNKGLDLTELRPLAARLRAVVAIGEAAGEVEDAFAGAGLPVRRARSMRDAVRVAAGLAIVGDAVLLSPACASFDWYPSYEARGRDFADEVAALATQPRR